MYRYLLAVIFIAGILAVPAAAQEDSITYEAKADDGSKISFKVTVDKDDVPVMIITDKKDRMITAVELHFEISTPYAYPVQMDCGFASIILDQDFHGDALQSEYLDIKLKYYTTVKREKCKYFLDQDKGIQAVTVRIPMEDFPIDQVDRLAGTVDGLFREDRQENFDKVFK